MNKNGIINNSTVDPNKILPMRYPWARQHYKDGVANNWTPEEVSMQHDVEQWKSITDPNFKTETLQDIQRFLHDLIGFYVIMEGIFFYAGFAMMLALKRQNKMIGIGEQFEYIMRDESLHLAFGCDLINVIKAENPEVWTESFQQEIVELIKQAVVLEKQYAHDACPQGMLGINADQFAEYV